MYKATEESREIGCLCIISRWALAFRSLFRQQGALTASGRLHSAKRVAEEQLWCGMLPAGRHLLLLPALVFMILQLSHGGRARYRCCASEPRLVCGLVQAIASER